VADILPELRMGVFYFHGRAMDNTPLVVIECAKYGSLAAKNAFVYRAT
jgi:hypothetical protein